MGLSNPQEREASGGGAGHKDSGCRADSSLGQARREAWSCLRWMELGREVRGGCHQCPGMTACRGVISALKQECSHSGLRPGSEQIPATSANGGPRSPVTSWLDRVCVRGAGSHTARVSRSLQKPVTAQDRQTHHPAAL